MNFISSGVQIDTLISATGCDSLVSHNLSVNQSPIVTFTLSSPQICLGQSAQITPNVSVSGGVFSWSTGDTTQNITVSPNQTTSYTLTYTAGGVLLCQHLHL